MALYIVGYVLFIVLGTLEAFLGFMIYRISLAIIGFFGGFLLTVYFVGYIYFSALLAVDEEWIELLVLVLALVAGLSVMLLAFILTRVGLFLVGASVGFFLALLYNNLALRTVESPLPFITLAVMLGILLGMLALCLGRWMVIGATAFTGAFALGQGILHLLLLVWDMNDTLREAIWIVIALAVGSLGAFVQVKWTASRRIYVFDWCDRVQHRSVRRQHGKDALHLQVRASRHINRDIKDLNVDDLV